ncbi:heme ABC transporter ATP-binding protein [Halalkalicoccus jeotgali]|uniref:Cobalamin import ATP-binding protein BtuD n=1 Tax=Halalkalicoccus jeotgali (strain DSM 18796 / CECT 7217 / JCM 14584 / KCTC 4019 / B3) TaxID=795797 RepID=D8J2R7_HALJB|nr:heme ABC transporter ATP-binding protein [Halalkalicoccus jeotgali]ADJ15024.1 ABC-type transport system ATP-binding protein (probable substrate iron-III) [Halalkalicoccus jeotgali B3]ELY34958.1 ABC transporter ATP-binding protein [Halalkalicoccus jeotgali B3]
MIDVRDLDVRLGGMAVLDSVSTSIGEGRFVGLVGPNGAGKSTLLRAIGAVLKPDAGTVLLGDEDVHDLPSRAASRRVATVPQDTSLSFDFDVREVVAMGRTPYRSRFRSSADPAGEETVERALSRTETEAFAERSIGAVSGGERQRVVLARALAQETPILLLDEPTASLDINHQIRTLELVRDLADDGKTVIAAIHDLNLAAHYCDELLLLSKGAIVDSGSPEDVLTESNLTRAFDARAVVSRHPVTGAVYVTALPERTGDREGRVHVIGGGGTVSRLLYVLSAAGYEVSVGALGTGDSDLETARLLGLDTVIVEPFAPIDAETRTRVSERIARADVTVLGDIEVGSGNLANLECALASDALVVVEDRPFEERNYAGADARALYEAVIGRGTVVEGSEVFGAVEEAMDRSS